MSVRLFNTLNRKKETFEPLESNRVRMYVCGPTVYNYIHIGNARPPIIFDVVRRYLEYKGYDVTYILNYTDVDDKLIRRAAELDRSVPEVAETFIRAYEEDMADLGVLPADAHPRVSDHMKDIIRFIRDLVEKGYAYESEGDVFFRTSAYPEYGKLSHQPIEELKAGARVDVNEKKASPLDFALWKRAKDGEIAWDSPWGKGRPGWHIECSAMARAYLGDTFDIHGGGHDLAFPHHENEITQTESLTGKPMARYWLHNGYINIENEKMSKSLGNVVLVRELRERFSGQIVRFFMLSTHYRNPISFSESVLQQSQNSLDRIRIAVRNLEHRLQTAADTDTDETVRPAVDHLIHRFEREMDDDFNTADAITVLFDLVREANKYLESERTEAPVLRKILDTLHSLGAVLGLTFKETRNGSEDEADIEAMIEERTKARRNKDFQKADAIRDKLQAMGIMLEDTPQGVRWRREHS